MGKPTDNNVNQNPDPIDFSNLPKTAIVDGKTIDNWELFGNVDKSKKPGESVLGSQMMIGSSYSKQGLEEQYEKTYEDLRTKAVEQEYDSVPWAIAKSVNGFVMHAGAALEEFIGTWSDPADWRITDLPDFSQEYDEDYDDPRWKTNPLAESTKEGLNTAFKYLDDHTIFGDGDEFGNWWTRRAAEAREESAIYNTVNTRSNWANTVLNYGSQIGGSIAGNMIGPGGFLKAGKIANAFVGGLKGLNATQQAVRATAAANTALGQAKQAMNTIAGAFIMTETTGFSIAQEVYNKTYEQKLYDLSPQLETAAGAAYDKAMQDAIKAGKSKEDAIMAAVQAKKAFMKSFADENPDMHRSAVKSAGKGAEVAVQTMAPSFLLNLTMSSAFLKTFAGVGAKNAVTRGLISKSPYSARGIIEEGVQEYVEEGVFESIAEARGMAAGAGRDYTLSDAWNTAISWESITGGLIGFGVGGGMKAGFQFLNSWDHKKKYEKQQEYIKKWNEIGAAAGQPDIVQQLTAPIQSAQELRKVLTKVNQLKAEGKDAEAKEESKKILALQAYDAYQSGTTKVLIDNWQKIANDDTLKPEVRQAANMAIKEIVAMENDFNESLKYENGRSVFQNRINQKQDTKFAQELKNKIFEKRTEAQLEVALLRQAGKLDLSYDEDIEQDKEIQWNEDGTIKEVVSPVKRERKELELELTPKGYVSPVEGVDASKQINQIKKEVKPYQEFLDLNEQLEATEIRIAEANVAYAEMTSKENQKNLKYQNMVLQEYQSMKGDLDALIGTDEYMKEVDSKILNHYKKKMDPEAFENFRQKTFVNPSNTERALKEIAEQIQLEEGLKKPEKEKDESEKTKVEIPFTNIPKESKIEIVATKLSQGVPLTAEEERFKNSNSIRVENKRQEIEKKKQNEQTSDTVTPEVVSEEGTATNEKTSIAQTINNIAQSEPKPKAPEVKVESKIDTIIKSTNANLNEQQREALEKELNKEKPNSAVVGTLLNIKKPAAQQIINEYKSNQEAVESNTDTELINFVDDLKKKIEASGQNVITYDLDEDDNGDLTEVGKKQLELINRLRASNNTDLSIIPNKSIENRYKIALPISNEPKEDSDAAIEDDFISFDPKEVDERLSPEAKNQLKEQVGDYLIALEDELGSEPTFEKFIRDYIVNSSKEQAKILFDTLTLGWELNGMPIENYKEVYDKVFRSRKEIANSLMQFAEEQKLVQQQSTEKEVNKINLESNTKSQPVETASGETMMVPIPLGDTVFRLAYNSSSKSGRLVKIEDEDGNLITVLEKFEEDEPDNFLKFKKLLRRGKFTPGTQLSVQILTDNLDEVLIKDREANGQVKIGSDGKPALISFKEWLAKNVKEKGIEFLKSQAYYDSVPLIVKDSDGDFVAYIHDISKVELNNELTAEQKATQIADIRALRKYLIDTENKGGDPKIEITAKTGGMTEKFPDKQNRKIRDINKKAILAKGIVNNNRELTHVYVSNGSLKGVVMPIADFYSKFKISDENRNSTREELKNGYTVDLREWSEGGEYKIINTAFPKMSEEIIDSVINALRIGLVGGKNKLKLIQNLEKIFGDKFIDNYISKFVRVIRFSQAIEGKRYFEITNSGKKIMFGVKGQEIVIENENDLNTYKQELIDYLSQENLNSKNKLINPTDLDSSEFKMGLVNEDGSIESSPYNYFEYSMKDAETDIRLENIGTDENPHFITKFQPNIEFKPVAPPNRNSNNYSSPKTETKEENKQLNNLVASTYTDEQLKKELPNLEAQGFEFIGDTVDEKVADIKKLLSENTNESTELAKQLDENLKEKLEQKTETKAQLEEISEQEYNTFIDKGVVSQERINSIANKIKNNQQLTQQEIAIFTNKTSEINKRLAELKTQETATPLEGFEEFFNIFAESSSVDEAIQKLIDNKTITKVCK